MQDEQEDTYLTDQEMDAVREEVARALDAYSPESFVLPDIPQYPHAHRPVGIFSRDGKKTLLFYLSISRKQVSQKRSLEELDKNADPDAYNTLLREIDLQDYAASYAVTILIDQISNQFPKHLNNLFSIESNGMVIICDEGDLSSGHLPCEGPESERVYLPIMDGSLDVH